MSATPSTGAATTFQYGNPNPAGLTLQERLAWSRALWKQAREHSFVMKFAGKSENAVIQRVTELTKTSQGDRAVMQLVADLLEDGVAGDNELLGNEEALRAYEEFIQIDQLRHANRNSGRMADQKATIKFRNQSKDKLAYWYANRMDQIAMLKLAGVDFDLTMNGGTRTGAIATDLAYRNTGGSGAPTANRHLAIVNGDVDLASAGGNTDANFDIGKSELTYNALVELNTFAREQMIRGVKTKAGGEELYHVFVTPGQLKQLKKDGDFQDHLRHAGVRGGKNPLFAGTESYMIDGMMIHSHRYVFNTKGAAGGNKWGSAGNTDGARLILCGAQALGMADLGAPTWDEEKFDYNNSYGIAVGKIFGFHKPQFHTDVTGTKEDFGCIVMDTVA